MPFDPKLLPYPHQPDRLYKYFENSLLKNKPIELIHPEGENGFPCSPLRLGFAEKMLTNPHERLQMDKSKLDPEDLKLLVNPDSKDNEMRAATSAVPWLRDSEVVSTVRATSARNEAKIKDLLALDTAGKIAHIEQTFESAKKALLSTLKHPKNPNLSASEIFPIFPDFDLWANPNIMVSFDADPIEKNSRSGENAEISMEEAILKPIVSHIDSQDQWVAYYLPTKNSVEKFKRLREDNEFEPDYNQVFNL